MLIDKAMIARITGIPKVGEDLTALLNKEGEKSQLDKEVGVAKESSQEFIQ
jgi:hypothetical protein